MGDGDVVKIADFGMSREDEGGTCVVQLGSRSIPIKWTAPEVYVCVHTYYIYMILYHYYGVFSFMIC